jgi:hypothetical protein
MACGVKNMRRHPELCHLNGCGVIPIFFLNLPIPVEIRGEYYYNVVEFSIMENV